MSEEYPMGLDQPDLEAFKETAELIRQACQQIAEAVQPIMDALAECFRQVHEGLTRFFFMERLKSLGLSERLSRWIAYHCPRRLLPVKWSWAPIIKLAEARKQYE